MTPTFYYMQGGQQLGPVTDSQLKQLLSSGQLRPHDLVWQHGMPAWTPAVQVPGLCPAVATADDARRATAGAGGAPSQAVLRASGQVQSAAPLPRSPLLLVGGGCFAAGMVVGILLGLAFGRGGSTGGSSGGGGTASGGRHPERLIGLWQAKWGALVATLDLKPSGRYEWRIGKTVEHTGTWKVESSVEGKYRILVVDDAEPDRTFGWMISPVNGDGLRIQGHRIREVWAGETFTRIK
jgi:hypothetical protein